MDGGALEGHEASQGLDFCDIDVFGITGSSFSGELMSFVLASVGGDYFDAFVIYLRRKVPLIKVRLNLTTLSAFL